MLQPAVQEVALKKPFSSNLRGGQPIVTNKAVNFFLIDSKILSSFFGVHQGRHKKVSLCSIAGFQEKILEDA
jgi:hypothetical protein